VGDIPHSPNANVCLNYPF